MSFDVDLHSLHRAPVVRVLRFAAAALGLAALITLPLSKGSGFSYSNYFSYFTVLSNILAVIVLLIGAVLAPTAGWFQWLRGLATTCMVITAIVYAMFLANVDVQLTTVWINNVMHRFLPLLIALDWIFVRAGRTPNKAWLTWLIAPLAYGIYTLIRGPIVDWYPYPFIDPREQGYGTMTISIITIFIGMIGLSAGVYWLGTWGSHDEDAPKSLQPH